MQTANDVQTTRTDPGERRWLHALRTDLFESDAAYFDAAATLVASRGATLSRLGGLETVAAATVIHRVSISEASRDSVGWIEAFEDDLRATAAPIARFYLQGSTLALNRAFERRGYTRNVELGFAADATSALPICAEHAAFAFRRVVEDEDWAAKLEIQRQCSLGADGHASDAEDFVTLERRKASAGYMTPYLITRDGEPCGATCVARVGKILRLKNLVVHPAQRRQGLGEFVARYVAGYAQRVGARGAGCFALEGHRSVDMYRRAGYRKIAELVEWRRDLDDGGVASDDRGCAIPDGRGTTPHA